MYLIHISKALFLVALAYKAFAHLCSQSRQTYRDYLKLVAVVSPNVDNRAALSVLPNKQSATPRKAFAVKLMLHKPLPFIALSGFKTGSLD
ncbi:hypothetical protein [Agarivorans sp. Alg241-V36]|uniref:hypothetical protein n=1 Tax=Agarivorans sp. Alg241-V36 TaxID=2305992 RepID=UPI0013D5460F|nr:hypothetical protein [Agarivorans sp. Alg241-V36]